MTQELDNLEEYKIFRLLSGIGCVNPSQVCTNKNCTKYLKEMELKLRSRGKEATKHLTWRCNGGKCGTYKSIWEGLEKFEELVREVLGDPEEELYLISDCSDTDSESGSSTNSESGSKERYSVDLNDFDEIENVNTVQVNEVSEVRESDKIFEYHQVCEDEITIEAS
ncbi:unnamed protein product, partial [Brachionus calyciflorus]